MKLLCCPKKLVGDKHVSLIFSDGDKSFKYLLPGFQDATLSKRGTVGNPVYKGTRVSHFSNIVSLKKVLNKSYHQLAILSTQKNIDFKDE